MTFARYPEYKDSGIKWLAEVPSHWKILPLAKTSTDADSIFIDGDWIESKDLSEDGIRYLTSGNVGVGKYKEQGSGFISSEKFDELQCVEVLPNDILISRLNLPLGRACLVPNLDGRIVTCVDNVIVRPDGEFERKFIVYLLSSKNHFFNMENLGRGTTMLRVSRSLLGRVRYAFPPKEEQNQIVSFLDHETSKIDSLIDEQENLIQLLTEKSEALITNAVTKGLNPSAKMKNSGVDSLGQIPEDWEISRFCYETWVRARLGWKGLKADEYVDEGYIFLATPNIKESDIDFENVNYISPERYEESPEIKLAVGDVLLAKDGSTLGTVNLVRNLPKPATVNSSIAVITPNERLNSEYLLYVFKSSYLKNIIQLLKGGMGVPHLFQGDINKIYLPIPPIAEQKAIVHHLNPLLSELENLMSLARSSIDLLKERRSAVITAAVIGQIDVRAAINKWEAE